MPEEKPEAADRDAVPSAGAAAARGLKRVLHVEALEVRILLSLCSAGRVDVAFFSLAHAPASCSQGVDQDPEHCCTCSYAPETFPRRSPRSSHSAKPLRAGRVVVAVWCMHPILGSLQGWVPEGSLAGFCCGRKIVSVF